MRSRTKRTHESPQAEHLPPEDRSRDAAPLPSLRAIDDAIERYVSRGLVTSNEVVDVLLEVRLVVASDARFAALVDDLERVR